MTDTMHTGEFNPGIGWRGFGNAVSIFQDTVWVIGPGGSRHISVTTFDVSKAASDWNVTDSKNWTSGKLRISGGFEAQTWGRPASEVVRDDTLYLFWAAQRQAILASSTKGPASVDATWTAPLALITKSGYVISRRSTGCDISAVAFGDGGVLVALPSAGNAGNGVYIGLFSPASRRPDSLVKTSDGSFGTWQADADLYLEPAALTAIPQNGSAVTPTILDPGPSVSISWFPFIPSSGTDPQFCLLAFMTLSLLKEGQNLTWPAQLRLPLDPASGAPLMQGAVTPLWMYDDTNPLSPISATRDPASRLLGYAMSYRSMQSFVYSTYSVPENAPPVITEIASAPSASVTSPTAVFHIDTRNPIEGKNGALNPDGSKLAFNIYRFVFYGGSNVMAQVDYFGMAEIMPEITGTLTPAPNVPQPLTRIKAIIEGPIPIPLANVIGFQFESDNPDGGDVTWGLNVTHSNTFSGSGSIALGVQDEGTTSTGFGPAWDISFSAGWVRNWARTSSETTVSSITQTSYAQTDPATKVGTGLQVEGTLVGTPPPNLTFTPARVVLANKTIIGDPTSSSSADQAPRFGRITLAPMQGTESRYTYMPYMVDPGDLSSYTPEAINQRMAAAYDKANLKRTWTNYFAEVMLPKGFVFSPSEPWLSFQFSLTGPSLNGFTGMQSEYISDGFKMDAHIYAGVGWGVDFPSIEDVSGSDMAGIDLSLSMNWGKTTETQTGINLTNWTFPVWGDQTSPYYINNQAGWLNAITNYSFLLFFLPPPKDDKSFWARELIALGGASLNPAANLDPSSQPWKICFVVTSYQNGASFLQKQITFETQENLNYPPS